MILVVSCVLAVFMFYNTGRIQDQGSEMLIELESNAKGSVRHELQTLADNISNYLLTLEAEIDRGMLNAAKVLYERDRLSGGTLTLEDLEQIRDETGMSDMYLADLDGVFTLSTEPASIGISLFDIWEGYRMLVTGEADYLPSDLKVKAETGEIFKFTAIPRANNMGILESALDAGAIEDYLQRVIENNEGIRSMNLFDSDLMTLTSNYTEGTQPVYTKGINVPRGATKIDAFFAGYTDSIIVMDKQNARIYYPVIDGDRVRYVLFIDLDASVYFDMHNLMESSITELVAESSSVSVISLETILAVLLVFTFVIVFLISKLVKKLEEALNTAEVASRAKSVFLSNISHEMRTPMNAIIGMTAIGEKANDQEDEKYALKKIGDASKHLLGIINDVLDMSKIEADKLELFIEEFNFRRMLNNTVSLVKYRIDEKRQTLELDVDENIPANITGDEQRLAQVITNLLSNAVKFTPEGGKIKLGAYLDGETDGNCSLRVEVTDNGIGISGELQKRIFSAFEQADGGTSRAYGGTGLGLAITKRIIELMGGSIRVESELGNGAKFTFLINVSKGEPKEKYTEFTDEPSGENPGEPVSGEFSGKRVLLAEDVDINREILISLLDDTGLTIDCAENGVEALEVIKAAPDKYDLVFMDLMMPQMGGLEATRHIRALPALQGVDLPIIAMTANVFKDDIEECLEAGMDDHIGKPIDVEKVFEKLRNYLN